MRLKAAHNKLGEQLDHPFALLRDGRFQMGSRKELPL